MPPYSVKTLRTACLPAADKLYDIFGITRKSAMQSWIRIPPILTITYHSKRFSMTTTDIEGEIADTVASYMENLEQLFDGEQLISDDIFLRSNRQGLGVYKQPINIDDTQYQVSDPSTPNLWFHCYVDVDVIIYVASLSSYYQASLISGVRKAVALKK